MKYNPRWELDTIPEDHFKSEVSRRTRLRRKTLGGGQPIRNDSPEAAAHRERMRRYRARLKEASE